MPSAQVSGLRPKVLPGFKGDPSESAVRYGSERGVPFAGAALDLVYQVVAEHPIAWGLGRNCGCGRRGFFPLTATNYLGRRRGPKPTTQPEEKYP
jgi:hypothetical protein